MPKSQIFKSNPHTLDELFLGQTFFKLSQHLILTWEYTKATSVLRFEDWSYKKHSPQPVESIQSPALSMVNIVDW